MAIDRLDPVLRAYGAYSVCRPMGRLSPLVLQRFSTIAEARSYLLALPQHYCAYIQYPECATVADAT